MERYEEPDSPWDRPRSREARNEQDKLRGALLNAIAIALLVTAFAGPYINPSLGETLTMPLRFWLAVFGIAMHLLARFAVRGMEDK